MTPVTQQPQTPPPTPRLLLDSHCNTDTTTNPSHTGLVQDLRGGGDATVLTDNTTNPSHRTCTRFEGWGWCHCTYRHHHQPQSQDLYKLWGWVGLVVLPIYSYNLQQGHRQHHQPQPHSPVSGVGGGVGVTSLINSSTTAWVVQAMGLGLVVVSVWLGMMNDTQQCG